MSVRGTPATRSRPLISIVITSSVGYAVPIPILISSAVRSPISRLYLRFTYWMIASSSLSPPTRTLLAKTMPESEMTATSEVPPPMSTIMLPEGSVTGRPAPIAAAIGCSMR